MMLNSLLDLGLTSIVELKAASRKDSTSNVAPVSSHPYAKLMAALAKAERSGQLASERRRLAIHRTYR